MFRSAFSLLLGSTFICMGSFPFNLQASNVLEGPDDAPYGKIVGTGSGIYGYPGYQSSSIPSTYLPSTYSNPYSSYPGYTPYYANPGYTPYYANPGMYNATNWAAQQRAAIDRREAKAGLDNAYYGPYEFSYGYGSYPYSYPSYSPLYSNPYYSNPYGYPGYVPYDANPGMYNPNTNFINPPSSLNYPTGYPLYSENYLYR